MIFHHLLQSFEADGVCSIANCLFPSGFSVGGTETAINSLKESAEKNGALQAALKNS